MILALWYHNILATLFALVAVLLMGVILLQRGRGVGLSGAFGGAGGHTAFGAKTGDVLTWATIVIAVVLLTFTVILNFVFVPLPALQVTTPPPVPAAPVLPADAGTEDAGTTPAAPATDAAQPSADAPAAQKPADAPAQPPAETPAQTPPPAETPAPADNPPANENPGGGEPPIWS